MTRRQSLQGIRVLAALFAACGLSMTAGCLRRSLSIRTEPAGAKVYVNDQLKGESPFEYDFMWYGWQRVTIRKDGYERLDDKRLIRAPVYLWIPFDLVMELLPFPIRDKHEWVFTLTPVVDASPQPPAEPEKPADSDASPSKTKAATPTQEWKK